MPDYILMLELTRSRLVLQRLSLEAGNTNVPFFIKGYSNIVRQIEHNRSDEELLQRGWRGMAEHGKSNTGSR